MINHRQFYGAKAQQNIPNGNDSEDDIWQHRFSSIPFFQYKNKFSNKLCLQCVLHNWGANAVKPSPAESARVERAFEKQICVTHRLVTRQRTS